MYSTIFTQKDGMPDEPIFDMIEDHERTIWMASYGGGIVRMKDSKITHYTFTEGLPNDVILKILEDNDGNLWLGSFRGILSF